MTSVIRLPISVILLLLLLLLLPEYLTCTIVTNKIEYNYKSLKMNLRHGVTQAYMALAKASLK